MNSFRLAFPHFLFSTTPLLVGIHLQHKQKKAFRSYKNGTFGEAYQLMKRNLKPGATLHPAISL